MVCSNIVFKLAGGNGSHGKSHTLTRTQTHTFLKNGYFIPAKVTFKIKYFQNTLKKALIILFSQMRKHWWKNTKTNYVINCIDRVFKATLVKNHINTVCLVCKPINTHEITAAKHFQCCSSTEEKSDYLSLFFFLFLVKMPDSVESTKKQESAINWKKVHPEVLKNPESCGWFPCGGAEQRFHLKAKARSTVCADFSSCVSVSQSLVAGVNGAREAPADGPP